MTPVPMTTVGLAGFGSSGRGIHAPLLQQAAELDRADDDAFIEEYSAGTPSGETPEESQAPVEPVTETVPEPKTQDEAGPDPETEAESQAETPPTPEPGPESQENHG